MAFQFKRDRSENLTLTLAGDIDLEITPDIKTQLASQLGDAASLTIDAANVSYLDSSGVSILVIAMQSCKQKQITLSVNSISEEAFRVLQLARLDKILPIGEVTGKAHLVDIDVFSDVGTNDKQIAAEVNTDPDMPTEENTDDKAADSDEDLIAALSSGAMDAPATEEPIADEPALEPIRPSEPQPTPEIQMTPQEQPKATNGVQPDPDGSPESSDGGSFKPGTFN